MKYLLILALLSSNLSALYSQENLRHELWLLKWKGDKPGKRIEVIHSNPIYASQPSFYTEHIVFTDMVDGQTDLKIYHIKDKSVTPFTETPKDGEYSGHITLDGRAITAVKGADQYLWNIPLDGSEPYKIMTSATPVGYFSWFGDGQLAMFILGEPMTLQIGNPKTNELQIIDENIGRSFHQLPFDSAGFSYIKNGDNKSIMLYQDGEISKYSNLDLGTDDITWTPDGKVVTGIGDKLFIYEPSDSSWKEIADFSDKNIRNITRMDISANGKYLVIVVQK